MGEATSKAIRVGIIDSGVSKDLDRFVLNRCAFKWQHNSVACFPASSDELGHGTTIAKTILQIAPNVELLIAKVFHEKWVTTPAQVAAAIDWLVMEGAQIINLSLGLRNDRAVLRKACQSALAQNVFLCAATPALGEPVYPASYPGVIRVTGDARCSPKQFSFINSHRADVGCCVKAQDMAVAGASVATGYFSGHLAEYLPQLSGRSFVDVTQWLQTKACYIGEQENFKHA